MLQFDSKLLTLLPYVCPQKETYLLCEILPIELAIVWLIERLNLDKPYALRTLSYIEDFKVQYFAVMYDYVISRWSIVSKNQWLVSCKEFSKKI